MAEWILVPVDDPDGCAGCFGCLVILAIASIFFGGGTAVGVSAIMKKKSRKK